MTEIPVALIVVLALGTVAAVALIPLFLRRRSEAARLRSRTGAMEEELRTASRHHALLTARVQSAEAEVRHLSGARVPDLLASLASHRDVPVRGPLHEETRSTGLDTALASVLDQISEAVGKERMRVDAAAQATLRGATTTIQALLYQLQTLLQQMQEKYDDPLVAEDLLAADFLNEQALRRIQSTAVVCGAWPGLTRQNSHLADIVVGASSRLSGYERVQVTNQLRDPVGVVARAVEPVAIALTELMANALHYSHPELPVAVTLQQGNRGASVIIDDAGVGMHPEELDRAARLMSGEEGVLITELGDPPRTGFATVGQLVRQYGFSTHVETSPYGGVRAVVHIPGEPLLTLLDEEEQPMSAMAPLPSSPRPAAPVTPGSLGMTGDGEDPWGPDTMSLPRITPATDEGRPGEERSGQERSGQERSGQERSGEADRTAEEAPAEGELPRRRRRRPAPDLAGPGAGEQPTQGYRTPEPAPAAEPLSPQRSAERWAAFQQGTASGRAAAAPGQDAGAPAYEPAPPPAGSTETPHESAESPSDPRSVEGNPPA